MIDKEREKAGITLIKQKSGPNLVLKGHINESLKKQFASTLYCLIDYDLQQLIPDNLKDNIEYCKHFIR